MDSDAWDERYAGSDYVWTVTANQFVERHLAGLVPLAVGIILLIRFLRRYPAHYPVVDEEALAKGGTDGRS